MTGSARTIHLRDRLVCLTNFGLSRKKVARGMPDAGQCNPKLGYLRLRLTTCFLARGRRPSSPTAAAAPGGHWRRHPRADGPRRTPARRRCRRVARRRSPGGHRSPSSQGGAGGGCLRRQEPLARISSSCWPPVSGSFSPHRGGGRAAAPLLTPGGVVPVLEPLSPRDPLLRGAARDEADVPMAVPADPGDLVLSLVFMAVSGLDVTHRAG